MVEDARSLKEVKEHNFRFCIRCRLIRVVVLKMMGGIEDSRLHPNLPK